MSFGRLEENGLSLKLSAQNDLVSMLEANTGIFSKRPTRTNRRIMDAYELGGRPARPQFLDQDMSAPQLSELSATESHPRFETNGGRAIASARQVIPTLDPQALSCQTSPSTKFEQTTQILDPFQSGNQPQSPTKNVIGATQVEANEEMSVGLAVAKMTMKAENDDEDDLYTLDRPSESKTSRTRHRRGSRANPLDADQPGSTLSPTIVAVGQENIKRKSKSHRGSQAEVVASLPKASDRHDILKSNSSRQNTTVTSQSRPRPGAGPPALEVRATPLSFAAVQRLPQRATLPSPPRNRSLGEDLRHMRSDISSNVSGLDTDSSCLSTNTEDYNAYAQRRRVYGEKFASPESEIDSGEEQ